MRKTVFLLASLFVMVLATQQMKAQTGGSASIPAKAKATIVEAIAIEEISELNFGKIVATPEGGKVQIQTDGSRTIAEGNVVLFDQGSDHQAANFEVTGTPNATYYLNFPDNISLVGPSGSTPMSIKEFVHSASGTIGDSGAESFNVGATLIVGANQTPGEYTGTYQVTAAYN